MTTLSIQGLKPLTSLQYDQSREKALGRVATRIGDKPTRKKFQRELAPIWTVLDIIALVIFVPALIVSSVHIITHMGIQANHSTQENVLIQAGTVISPNDYVAIHQWGYIPMAEGAMILFMVMFGMTKGGWRRYVYLLIALAALLFLTIANWQSGIGVLEALLAPIFTVGIGLKLELLIIQMMQRRKEVDENYLKALAVWEAATADATKHPDYIPLFRQEVWAALVAKNKDYADAPRGFKYAAVEREMARDKWAYDPTQPEDTFEPVEEIKPTKPVKEVQPVSGAVPFGEGGGLMLGENVSMPVTLSANGHGTTETN